MAEPNFANRTLWTGDNLAILRGMNSECVDLIYLDPPFNSNADYAAPIGSQAAGAAFKDTWTLSDVDAEWVNLIEAKHPALRRVLLAAMSDSDKSYLVYMAARMLEMQRVLKPTGSIYLHCDPTMSHYLKLVMDAVFGRRNFRNEIAWCYTGPQNTRKHYPRKHDILLFYSFGDATFNKDAIRVPSKWNELGGFSDPSRTGKNKGKVPEDWWHITFGPNTPERTGYPTQKPLALLDRIIRASSNPGDVVLDPFCGCATAMVAADRAERKWAGIDISPKAVELVNLRLQQAMGSLFHARYVTSRTDIPLRADLGDLPHYRTHSRTLYGLQEGNCGGCGHHFEARHLEVDHIISRGKGGTDHIENLQLLCGNCNRIKGDRGMDYLLSRLQLASGRSALPR